MGYPKVYEAFEDFRRAYGDLEGLPTHIFLNPMREGDVVDWRIKDGYRVWVKLESISPEADSSGRRDLTWQINGERWFLHATDDAVMAAGGSRREKVSPAQGKGAVSAGMPGVCVD